MAELKKEKMVVGAALANLRTSLSSVAAWKGNARTHTCPSAELLLPVVMAASVQIQTIQILNLLYNFGPRYPPLKEINIFLRPFYIHRSPSAYDK